MGKGAMGGRGRPTLPLMQGSLKVKGRADGDIGPYTGFTKAGGILRTNDACFHRPSQAVFLPANKPKATIQ